MPDDRDFQTPTLLFRGSLRTVQDEVGGEGGIRTHGRG
jgi:hypothetical protein